MRIVNNEIVQVPVLAYYKTNREMVQNGDGISRMEQESREFTYSNAFSTKIDDFQDLLEWFRYQEDLENQEKIDRKNFDYTNTGLQVVREAVSKFLNCFDAKFDNLKVRRIAPAMLDFREAAKQWNLVISKNGLELKIAQLSSGERALVALVADIARRAAIANPQLPNPLNSEGVILIDEVELHLHPTWQRAVAKALRATFPNIQFILTTHSPQVLSTLKRENVFMLEDFKLVKDTPHTYGRDSNSILWDIFGVEKRPAESKEEFSRLYRLMDDESKAKETESLLHDVEEKYGYYDEEVVRARAHFQFLNES
jgi:predicted ATP-binding protein involved in virulence